MIAVKRDTKDTEYTNILLKTSVDICKISDGVLGNFLTKIVMENFRKSSNFEMKCPFETGNHTVTNLEVSDKFIPILREFEFKYQSEMFGKVGKVKKLVHIYTYQVFGVFKKN